MTWTSVCIGGFYFREARIDGTISILPEPYLPFTKEGPADVVCQVHTGFRQEDSTHWEPGFQAETNWEMFAHGNQLLIRTQFIEAYCDKTFQHIELYPLSGSTTQDLSLFSYPLSELVCMHLLAQRNGALLHACAVLMNNTAVLFCGESGAGKSTMAGLWHQRGYTILSDDRIIARKMNKKLIAMGTPWHGDAGLSAPLAAPVSAIYFLRHGTKNHCEITTGANVIALLLQNSFLPLWEKEIIEKNLLFFEQCLQSIPCKILEFVADDEIISFIREEHNELDT